MAERYASCQRQRARRAWRDTSAGSKGDDLNMKKILRRLLVCACAAAIVFAQSQITVFADAISDKINVNGDDNYTGWNDEWNTAMGQCGDAVAWTLDLSTGSLTVIGAGEMWNRDSHGNKLWNASDVKSVSFSGKITSIGAGVFSGSNRLKSMSIPGTVRTIGEKAFQGCTALKDIGFANTVNRLGDNCFTGCLALSNVYYTGSRQDWLFLTDGVETGLNSSAKIHYTSTVSITLQPSNVNTCSGDTTRFSVKAKGNGSLKYQWYYRKKGVSGWSLWRGHTTATTSATANDTWNGMQVYCRIEDSSNYVSSDISVITLQYSFKITSQPSGVALNVGDKAKFTVKARGSGLKYQWYYKKAGAGTWSIWKGHTTASTSAVANSTWDGMQVYCKVSDNLGNSASSQPASIKLNGLPKITAQPSDVELNVGDKAKFTVKVQGSNLKYQWYYKKNKAKSWSIWKGHTTATTSAVANSTWDGMQVYCKITDGFGRIASSDPAVVKLKT